ncbi:MAG: hypothetical protein RUMPE_00697 [Eubacteriales bacterium SKADARSKE-1]|nr:hypothetical protein [Eubacteriales bacterium SKADARSKE-1]
MKKIICFIFLLFFFTQAIAVFATDNFEEIYNEQIKTSAANELCDNVPEEAKDALEDIGINKIDWNDLIKLTPKSILEKVLSIAKDKSPSIFKAVASILAIVLLSALFSSMKTSIAKESLQNVWAIVSTLCICMIAINPIISTISYASNVISGASKFLLCYIPIMVGVMIVSGQGILGASYSALMLTVGEVMAQVSSILLVPLLNVFLVLSIVSSISPRLNFSGICNLFSKTIKWILGFAMAVFTGLLTIQSIVGTAADNIGTKAAKFVLSGCVPVVGSALSDAFLTVQSSVKLLKSGVGAFFILALGFVFLPVVMQCLLWLFSVNFCASIGELFELSEISKLLKRTGEVISTILVILLCSAVVLIISTVVVLTVGGSS